MPAIDPVMAVFIGWSALSLATCGWAIFDAMRAPAAAWWRSGQSRSLWIALLVVALCVGLGPLAVAAYVIVPFPAVRTSRDEASFVGTAVGDPVAPGDSVIP